MAFSIARTTFGLVSLVMPWKVRDTVPGDILSFLATRLMIPGEFLRIEARSVSVPKLLVSIRFSQGLV